MEYCAHVSFKSDQLKLFGTRECREVGEREMIQRTALANISISCSDEHRVIGTC